MVFDPQEFFEIANQLYLDKHYQNEPSLRTVISRAYYACFLASQKRLQELGASFPDVNRIHRDVIENVKGKNSRMGNHLETLRTKRVDADYKLNANITRGECGNLLKLAEYVLGEAGSLK